ncbi:hypothetical protein LCGC14_0777870 [marine sediment metagenome]|uniref:Uncharacterized protein n=1 Tax=marine sediment metagenome TaxID=412755 RepID=A0A0F9PWK4_9ZZZZ
MGEEFTYTPDPDGPVIGESPMDLFRRELKKWEVKIDRMSRLEMARMRRYAPAGHLVFDKNLPLFDRFVRRFESMGGMSLAVSKAIARIREAEGGKG